MKKILALCLVVVLAVTAVTGATLAYFTDSEQKTNTMVIGNVEINLEEYSYVNGKFEPFENDKDELTLYPIDNKQGQSLFNKWAYTANTSDSKDDAYIRTIVLIEKNTELGDTYVNEGGATCCFPGMHYAADGIVNGKTHTVNGVTVHTCVQAGTLQNTVTIDGNEYWVVWYVDSDGSTIPYGEALSSLVGVHMDKNITQDQIKGWYDYDASDKCINTKVDIIVFSQGIQAKGLTHADAMTALGEVNQANLTQWLKGDADKNIDPARQAIINDLNK